MTILQRAAKQRGLNIRAIPSLTGSPFRAMNPRAAQSPEIAKQLKGEWPDNIIGYDPMGYAPYTRHTEETKIEDVNHELLEFDKQGEGWPHKKAHKYAEKHQNHIDFVSLIHLLNANRGN